MYARAIQCQIFFFSNFHPLMDSSIIKTIGENNTSQVNQDTAWPNDRMRIIIFIFNLIFI